MTQTGQPQDTARIIAHPLKIFLGMTIAGGIAHVFLDWRWLPDIRPWSWIAAGALLGLVVVINRWVKRTMRRAGTPTNPREPSRTLVTTGIFRVTRNPLYLCLILIHLAIAVGANAAVFLITAAVLFGILHFGVVLREEDYLMRKFGPSYQDYTARVRRWL